MKNILCHGLVDHLLKCNLKQILDRSLMHCHSRNLHSIMLLECPEKTIRMFVAEADHEMYRNCPWNKENQSLGFHPHHCDLTLSCVRGNIYNWVVEEQSSNNTPKFRVLDIDEYRYNSQITAGKIGFNKIGRSKLESHSFNKIVTDAPVHMEAKKIHTVYVPAGETAAWFALEGLEDPNYKNSCWSYANLEEENFDHLYKPMDEENLRRILSIALG